MTLEPQGHPAGVLVVDGGQPGKGAGTAVLLIDIEAEGVLLLEGRAALGAARRLALPVPGQAAEGVGLVLPRELVRLLQVLVLEGVVVAPERVASLGPKVTKWVLLPEGVGGGKPGGPKRILLPGGGVAAPGGVILAR